MNKLIQAVQAGDQLKVQQLLEAGHDANCVDKDGTPVIFWTIAWHPKPKIAELLLAHGANPNVVVASGLTPLTKLVVQAHYLYHHGERKDDFYDNIFNMAALLKKYGAVATKDDIAQIEKTVKMFGQSYIHDQESFDFQLAHLFTDEIKAFPLSGVELELYKANEEAKSSQNAYNLIEQLSKIPNRIEFPLGSAQALVAQQRERVSVADRLLAGIIARVQNNQQQAPEEEVKSFSMQQ